MYTGMGQEGDQSLAFAQNKTLAESDTNGVDVHLFEVHKAKEYTYVGRVELAGEPEQGTQSDKNGSSRLVWRFPLRICAGETISQEIFDKDQENTAKKAQELDLQELKKKIATVPKHPNTVNLKSTTFERGPYVAEYAKKVAEGICQLCGNPAPFNSADGHPYLESHHVQWLSEGGEDSIENIIALCPNCHRKMHIVGDKSDILKLKERALALAKKA